MTLEQVDLADFLTKTLMPGHRDALSRYTWVDAWAGDTRPGMAKPKLPSNATSELIALAALSATPWGNLLVETLVQVLYVEGYRRPDGGMQPGWEAWQRNGMDARQILLHEDAVKYGLSYMTVLPTAVGSGIAKMRPKSPKRMTAFYDDPVDDEWPLYALELKPLRRGGSGGFRCLIYDEQFIWQLDLDSNGRIVSDVSRVTHGLGVCPVVRFVNKLDLATGEATGEVSPYVTLFHRIDQTVYDRLVVQRFASWVVRTISGMAPPEGVPLENVDLTQEQTDALEAAKVKLSAANILVSDDPNTVFGSIPASPLEPFNEAKDSDVRDLSAVAQVPSHSLLGVDSNLGAEALASAEKGQARKRDQRQHTLGESHEQALALAERIEGKPNDLMAQVKWKDTDPADLAAVADALVKLQTVNVPQRALFERVPDATQTDVDDWLAELKRTAAAAGGVDAADLKAKFDALGVAIRAGADPQSAASSLGLAIQFTGAVPTSLRLPTEQATQVEAVGGGGATSSS